MNSFNFVGTISSCKIKTTTTNKKYLSIIMNENYSNTANLQMYCDNLSYNGTIPVYFNSDNEKHYIKYEDRFDQDVLMQVKNFNKYRLVGNRVQDFILKDDFIEKAYDLINSMPENTVYRIVGEFNVSKKDDEIYYNFHIKHIKVDNSAEQKFTMKLDLFYNFQSINEEDKRNKFILNCFIEQYCYPHNIKEYFPLQCYFITNKYDFSKAIDIEIIKHRKANLSPNEEDGYVKATWEAQYIKGAQLVVPPLETLPFDAQFEIKYAGRKIEDYAGKIVGKANEYICLTRPYNLLTKDNKVFTPLEITNEEFKNKIHKNIEENERNYTKNTKDKSFDSIAKEDTKENPFNFK